MLAGLSADNHDNDPNITVARTRITVLRSSFVHELFILIIFFITFALLVLYINMFIDSDRHMDIPPGDIHKNFYNITSIMMIIRIYGHHLCFVINVRHVT